MDKKTRLATAFDLELPDRPPILGGWLAAPEHIQTLTGCSEDDYWSDPFRWGLDAERILGSDGVITVFQDNEFYPSDEAYLQALAEVMKEEYEAIVDAGFILQIDCPDLAMGRHTTYRRPSA